MSTEENRITTPEEDLATVTEFELFLNKLGIKISKNNEFIKCKENIKKLTKVIPNENNLIIPISPEEIRKVVFLTKLAETILIVKERGEFDYLIPHLKLLTNCSFFGRSEFKRANNVTNENTNKIFELFIAAALNETGQDLDLAPPKGKNGNRPDLKIRIDDVKYGIENKVLNSKNFNPSSLFHLMKKGTNQITNCNDIHKGFVFINIINVIPHQVFLPAQNIGNGNYLYKFITEEEIQNKIKTMLDEMHYKFKDYQEKAKFELSELFFSPKIVRMWVYYIITVGFVKMDKIIGRYFYQNLEATNIIDASNLKSESDYRAYDRNKKLIDKISKALHKPYKSMKI